MPSYANNVADIVLAYHRTPRNNKIVDLTCDYRNHFFGRLAEKKKTKTKNSKTFHTNYMVNGYDNVQLDSYYNPDSVNRQDLGLQSTYTWSLQKTHWMVDRREPGWGGGATKSQMFDHLLMQEVNMHAKFYDRNERLLWTVPASPNDGSSAVISPCGIPSHITNPTTAAISAQGGHPAGWSTGVNGLNRATYPQLKNMGGKYSSIGHVEFGEKAQEMIDMLQWRSPRPDAKVESPTQQYEIVSGYAPYREYSTLATLSNESLGPDMGKFRGRSSELGSQLFRGILWTWSDALTQATLPDGAANIAYPGAGVDPVYFLDWSTWDLICAEGFWMNEDPPRVLDNPHNVVVMWYDTIYQIDCNNPRANGVMTRGT